MNYYRASQIADENGKPTGKFHFTVTRNKKTIPIGYCGREDSKCDHNSPEEASNCYRKYCIEECNGMMAGFEMSEDEKKATGELNITSSY